jgi:hypothetical protein
MAGLRPNDHPADTLRWVRRVHLVMLPASVLVALVLWADHASAWWLALLPAVFGVAGLATIGPAIRRAEAHGPNDPATRPARLRRAQRVTLVTFSGFTLVAVVVSLAVEGPGLAITMGVLMSVSLALGLWASGRWLR